MYLPVDDDDMGSTSVFKCFLKLSRDTRLVAQQNPSQHRSFGVKLFAEHKEFIDQKKYAEQFDSRSNLHSSVIEVSPRKPWVT
jgi:hypothetical protein